MEYHENSSWDLAKCRVNYHHYLAANQTALCNHPWNHAKSSDKFRDPLLLSMRWFWYSYRQIAYPWLQIRVCISRVNDFIHVKHCGCNIICLRCQSPVGLNKTLDNHRHRFNDNKMGILRLDGAVLAWLCCTEMTIGNKSLRFGINSAKRTPFAAGNMRKVIWRMMLNKVFVISTHVISFVNEST